MKLGTKALLVGFVATAGLVLFIGSEGMAQNSVQGQGGSGAGLHGKGKIDTAKILQKHPELDTNKDGVLSDDELKAGRAKLGRSGFGPGGRPEAFRPDSRVFDWLIENFAEADADGNGQISRDELTKMRDKYAAMEKGFGPASESILKRFPEADTNKDGKLSREEFEAFRKANPGAMRQALLEKHPEIDTNGDGQVSDEEFNAARDKHRTENRGQGEHRGFKNRGKE